MVDANYQDIFELHKSRNNDVTIVASIKEFNIPYRVCEIGRKGLLKNIKEKPNFQYLVNTGLYLVNKKIINLIPKNKYFDFTDLINVLQKRRKIGVFNRRSKMDRCWSMGHF